MVRKVGMGTYAALPQDYTPTALVVDDDERLRTLMARALMGNGWNSVVVESGEQALDQLKERPFDVVFLDLVMPGLNGAETFRKIRALDPEAVVVIITGYPHSVIMADALQVGPFAVVRKPFSLDEIRLMLRHVANRSRSPANS